MRKVLKIYNASAGSGKTYTLVKEYLRLVIHPKRPETYFRTILAMTFTNKAAAEMKNRIINALKDLSVPYMDKSKGQLALLADYANDFKLDPLFIEEKSAKVLHKILHRYSFFSVMTLDKFTHRIIRTFARDLNISMDFDVELDNRRMQRDATELLMEQIGKDANLTRLMLHYAQTNMEDNKSWDFTNSLMEFSKQIFKEDAIQSIDKLKALSPDDFIKIGKNLRGEIHIFENRVRTMALEALDLMKSRGITADDLIGRSKSIYTYFEKLQTKIENPSSSYLKYSSVDDLPHKQSPNKAIVAEIAPLIVQYFNQIHETITKNWSDYTINLQLAKEVNNMSLLGHVVRILDEIKEEQNVLLISDFYKKIAEIVQNEPVPFIYERLGIRYQHFLLDEFQDTSHMQWVNVVPLIHNSIASENENLIVGDGKQAIYRWRNGEVAQFINLPEKVFNPYKVASLTEAEPQFKAAGIRLNLEKNYRSAPEIVQFNNDLFTHVSNNLGGNISFIYKDLKQIPVSTAQGFVEVNIQEKFDSEEQINYVLECIQRSLNKGFSLKDIAVLVRKKDKGREIAAFLNEKGYDVVSPDSLFVGSSLTVKLVVQFLKVLQRPKDSNTKIRFLEFFALVKTNRLPIELIQDFKERLPLLSLEAFCQELGFKLPDTKHYLNLYELITVIFQRFELEATGDAFLNFFMNQIYLYEKNKGNNLRSFLQWFDEFGYQESVTAPANQNALQLMTIHKAKGLEFPVVIAPFLEFKKGNNGDLVWVEEARKDLPAFFFKPVEVIKETEYREAYEAEIEKMKLDDLNLLYVTLTRPERALFMSANTSGMVSKAWILPFLSEKYSQHYQDGKYCFGELSAEGLKEDKAVAQFPIHPLTEKLDRPKMSFQVSWDDDFEEAEIKRSFGTELHMVLSKISSSQEVEKTIDALIRKGEIHPANKTELLQQIQELFEDEKFQSYFEGDKIWNEKAIIDIGGKKLIPDKIIKSSHGLMVVDFKTGHPMKSHFSQVRKYITVLQEMGYTDVTGELYYTQNKEVKEL